MSSSNHFPDEKSLFSDGTSNFLSPSQPDPGDTVEIALRARRGDIDGCTLVSGGRHIPMHLKDSDSNFDYFAGSLQLQDEPVRYYFELHIGDSVYNFTKKGVRDKVMRRDCFRIVPGFHTPDWAQGAVMYQIFVDRFCNGDPDNDVLTGEYVYDGEQVSRVEDWNSPVANLDIRRHYGGDLQGVIDKLDYLRDLGIQAVYLNPIFLSPSNHKYDTQDYSHVDPHFGKIVHDEGRLLSSGEHDNRRAGRYLDRIENPENLKASDELFAKLVQQAHARGIKVIVDGVFNHCGSFSRWMDRERIYEAAPGYRNGAYISEYSPYRNFFDFKDEDGWPYNDSFDCWWGVRTLPKLNYEKSQKLVEEVLQVAAKWVSPPYNADGWRLDVAADLGHSREFNHNFWKRFRKAVRDANPDALIIAENYENSSEWLQGDEWDGIMNYEGFMEPVSWFLTGMEKHSDQFRSDMLGNTERFWDAVSWKGQETMSSAPLYVSMNELSNHDHSRFLTRTNRKVGRVQNLGAAAASEWVNKAVFREAVVLQMTLPGMPTVYYGDEAGVCGFTDPDDRRTYPWGHEDKELLEFHRNSIRMHRTHKCLQTGSLLRLEDGWGVLTYARFTRDETVVVALNNNEGTVNLDLDVFRAGVSSDAQMEVLLLSDARGAHFKNQTKIVRGGRLKLSMPRTSAIVLRYGRTEE